MKALKSLLLLFAVLASITSCSDNSDELISTGIRSSRSVATTYYLDGADKLYTGSPETYIIKTTDGSPLPVGLKATWNYPTDLYRVGYSDISITFGRKLAVGNYTIIGTLNNGGSVSKTITAIDGYKPNVEGGQESQADIQKTATSLYIRPVGISRYYDGPYDNIDEYKYVTHKYYYMDVYDLHLKCSIENTTENKVRINQTLLAIAYGDNSGNISSANITDGNNQILPQYIDIEKGQSMTVIYHLDNNWYQHTLTAGVTVFNFSYSQYAVSSTGYGYLLSRTNN